MNINQLPFSYHWIMVKLIGQVESVLDLGCGDGAFTADVVKGKNWKIIGVELYPESIKLAKAKKIYQKVIKANLTPLSQNLPKTDLVLASQVIEHFPKKQGLLFLSQIEKLANKKIIVSTPVGFVPFHQIEKDHQDQNPLQKHLSGWSVKEFEKKGYRVYGQGAKWIYSSSFVKKLPKEIFPVINLLSFIMAPIVFFYPQLAMYMIAVKTKK